MRSMLRVTKQAKENAKEALEERKELSESEKYGLSKSEAKDEGVRSGVERAKQIIRKSYYDWKDSEDRKSLISMARFYSRFQNCRSKKCEGAMKLWGGRWWLRNEVVPFVNEKGGYNY